MTMTSLQIAFVILLIIFGGAVLGLLIGRRLPPHHMSSETKAVVSVSMAVVGTMSALVIGLLISGASSSFTARNRDVGRLSADIIRLDTLLRRYGPESNPIRDALQRYTTLKFEDLFLNRPDGKPKVDNPATAKVLDDVQDLILALRARLRTRLVRVAPSWQTLVNVEAGTSPAAGRDREEGETLSDGPDRRGVVGD